MSKLIELVKAKASFVEIKSDICANHHNVEYINLRDSTGCAALIYAASQGDNIIVQLLLGAGANIETTCKYGLTPLMRACSCGHLETISLLLLYGADINFENEKGLKAIDYCAPSWRYLVENHQEAKNIQ